MSINNKITQLYRPRAATGAPTLLTPGNDSTGAVISLSAISVGVEDAGLLAINFNGDSLCQGAALYAWDGAAWEHLNANPPAVTPGLPAGTVIPGPAAIADILAGIGTNTYISPLNLLAASTNAAATTSTADANKYLRLNGSGKINPAFFDIKSTRYLGHIDVVGAAYPADLTNLQSGDFITVKTAGNASTTWEAKLVKDSTITVTNVAVNDMFIYAEEITGTGTRAIKAGWHHIEQPLDMTPYLKLAGGTMSGDIEMNNNVLNDAIIIDASMHDSTLQSCIIHGGTF